MGDLIDFSVIEGQKENIQSLPSGRSARTLANLYSVSPLQPLSTPTPSDRTNVNDAMRQEYEDELANISESDDPLDIFDRYVKWNMDAYPSAQATKESQLLPLLERATKTFLDNSQYKNDPRYMKLWLLYIRLFSDAPRETFAFLARHSIGDQLALFYEEFAAWLESAGRWAQAEEIYNLGMQKEARPAARLARKHHEFQQRLTTQPQVGEGPASPALPLVRAALTAKIDPFAASAAAPLDPQAVRSNSGTGPTSKPKSGKAKMQIFADADDVPPAVLASDPVRGWDSIGSLADRRKENTIQPKAWAGETLKGGGKKSGAPKMAVFKDETPPLPMDPENIIVPRREQVIVNVRTKRHERIFVNLEVVYPTPEDLGTEMSFEELRAANRGWLSRQWTSESVAEPILSSPVEAKVLRELSFEEVNKLPNQHKIPVFTDKEAAQAKKSTGTAKLQICREVEAQQVSKPVKTDVFVDDENNPRKGPKQPKLEVFREDRNENVSEAPEIESIPIFSEQTEVSEGARRTNSDVRHDNPQENSPMLDENGAVKVPLKEGRGKKMRVMEENKTQIIKTKLSSPSTNKKVKRKGNAEPTMTFHTKAATDEIYDLFSQPLASAADEEEDDEEEESEDEDDEETDGDYTSGGESTATGRLLSEAGNDDDDDDDNENEEQDDETDTKSASGWSDYTASKHVPGTVDEEEADGGVDDTRATQLSQEEDEDADDEVDTEPNSPEQVLPRTSFVPIPPEDYVAPTRPFRNAEEVNQNRLPFMTPIAEKTESSFGALTNRVDKEYFKTPSKENGPYTRHSNDQLSSSPFQEMTDEDVAPQKIQPPDLSRSVKALQAVTATAKPKAVQDLTPKGPIIKDLQCNPVDDYTRDQIFTALQPPLTAYDGYFDHKDESLGRSAELRKFCKAVSKMSKGNSDKTATNITIPPILTFPGTDKKYMVKRELGAGAFAPVFLIENIAEEEADENSVAVMGKGAFDPLHRQALEALKMEDPPTAWEFYITRQAKRRLGVSRAAESIINVYEMHLYKDECYLIEEYRDQGTLLDLVNVARADSTQAGGVMDEILAMFFTIEMLRTVEALHSKGILHGDLKADNCLVRLEALSDTEVWSTKYCRNGSGGWNKKGVSLIDFGRGIDMKFFLPNVQFIADWKTCPQDCAEMRELRPWTYQIDYHGLAGIIHSLLFSKYIDPVADKPAGLGSGTAKTYRIRESLKRYWQTDIWGQCFDLLLNPQCHVAEEEGLKMPLLKSMRSVREKMEAWVETNCDRGIGLQALIRKVEFGLLARRK